MFLLFLALILSLSGCDETNTPVDTTKSPSTVVTPTKPKKPINTSTGTGTDSTTTTNINTTTSTPKPDISPADDAAARALISKFNSADATRKLESTALSWTPLQANLDEFTQNDPGKVEILSKLHLKVGQKISQALGFYDKNDPGGAFANTYEAQADINYKGQKSPFAEIFFQAEKILRYAKNPASRVDFAAAFKVAKELKKNQGWFKYVNTDIRSLVDLSAKAKQKEWDALSIDLMGAIHAARFRAEPDLFLALVSSSGRNAIVENAGANDSRWGNGGDGLGKNFLGLLYMSHRQRFWKDFKAKFGRNFDKNQLADVAYMLEWLKNYEPTK